LRKRSSHYSKIIHIDTSRINCIKLLYSLSIINRHSQLYVKRNSPTNCLDCCIERKEDANASECKNTTCNFHEDPQENIIVFLRSSTRNNFRQVHISTLWTHKITFFCIIIMSKNESAKSHQFQRDKTLLIRTRVWSFNGMEKSRRNWSEENDVSCVWHWTQVQVRHRRSVPLWKEILMLILRNVNLMFRGIR